MDKGIPQLLTTIEALRRSITKTRSKQLNSKPIKDRIRSFVYDYFKDFRQEYLSTGSTEENASDIDSNMQDLLRCTQRSTLKITYLHSLKTLRKFLCDLELKDISLSSERADIPDNDRDRAILDTLAKINPSSALSYEQALTDLQDQNRKSWRGTAVEFRESLRELLDSMAPDNDVVAQPGFKLEENTKKPTMKQKAVFILKSRQASGKNVKTFTDAIDVADELLGKFVRSVYDRSSVGTHTPISKDEVLRIRGYVSLALSELLEIKV
jgi:hypothetical protein